jgi:putative chitinase
MGAKADVAAALGAAAARYLPQYDIASTLSIAHFLAQGAHETGGFRIFVEIWGPTDAQRGYEGRADLGNTTPGDGFRFRGRGIFQLTGRANYTDHGLADTPDKAAEPDAAVRVACEYWRNRNLNELAEADDVLAISIRINGRNRRTGLPNGYDDRRAMLKKAKGLMGVS